MNVFSLFKYILSFPIQIEVLLFATAAIPAKCNMPHVFNHTNLVGNLLLVAVKSKRCEFNFFKSYQQVAEHIQETDVN